VRCRKLKEGAWELAERFTTIEKNIAASIFINYPGENKLI
jgi:hypothetical protein